MEEMALQDRQFGWMGSPVEKRDSWQVEQSEQELTEKIGWRLEEAAKRDHHLGQLATEFCPYLKAVAEAFPEGHWSVRSIWGGEKLRWGRSSIQEQMGDRRDGALRGVAQVPYGQFCRTVSHKKRWGGWGMTTEDSLLEAGGLF